MGVFDYLKFKAPLPEGTPDLEWQTKDTPEQYCEQYEVREDGTLWYQDHDTEDRSDPTKEGLERFIGCATSVNHRWVPCNMTGEIRFYGYEGRDVEKWWEFSAYFIAGKMQSLTEIERPKNAALTTDRRMDGGG